MTAGRGMSGGLLIAALAVLASGCATGAKPSAEEPPRAVAGPVDPAAVNQKVESLLSNTDRAASDEDWQRLGPEALVSLDRIYADPSTTLAKRARAVAAMGQVSNADAELRLQAIIADEKAVLRTTAVLALGRRAGDRAVAQISPLLESADPLLRDAAAQALGRVPTPEARHSLEERLANEQDPRVRETIQHSLTQQVP